MKHTHNNAKTVIYSQNTLSFGVGYCFSMFSRIAPLLLVYWLDRYINLLLMSFSKRNFFLFSLFHFQFFKHCLEWHLIFLFSCHPHLCDVNIFQGPFIEIPKCKTAPYQLIISTLFSFFCKTIIYLTMFAFLKRTKPQ